jgi:uncharacterized membrane protein
VTEAHPNARLEAFGDGVFAIALTLLVLDIRLPNTEAVGGTAGMWRSLQHLTPAVGAFLLSYAVIFVTWVNHRAALRLVSSTSAPFLYANGFLLLTVVFIPFPTTLVSESVLTDHAAPAVVLYNSVLVLQALGWIAVTGAALGGRLTRDEGAAVELRKNRRHGYEAIPFYSALAILGLWFPHASLGLTILSWLFWLALGIRMKDA